MIRTLMGLFVSLLLGLTAPVQAGEVTQDQATDKLIGFLGELHSLHADFEQWVMTSGKQGQMQHVKGQMWMQRPGQFRWDTGDPYPQQIVSDASVLWIYDPDLEQATRKKLDKQLGNTPALLLSGDPQQITEGFDVSAYRFDESGEWRFDLHPKDSNVMFSLLRVHFFKGQLRDMYLEDSLGQVTRIEFKVRQRNQPLDPAIFKLKLDDDVDIIEDST